MNGNTSYSVSMVRASPRGDHAHFHNWFDTRRLGAANDVDGGCGAGATAPECRGSPGWPGPDRELNPRLATRPVQGELRHPPFQGARFEIE